MVILNPTILCTEVVAADPSKFSLKLPSTLELILQERDPAVYRKGFDILLEARGEGITGSYKVYFSPDNNDAEQNFKRYLQQLRSGEYHVVIDIANQSAIVEQLERL